MFEDADKQVESPKDAKGESGESLLDQLNSGMSELAEKAKAHVQILKDGGKSGVTDQFGKVELAGLDDAGKSPAGDVGQARLDASLGVGGGRPGGGVADAATETSDSPTPPDAPADGAAVADTGSASPYGSAYRGEGLTRNIEPGKAIIETYGIMDDLGNDVQHTQTVEEVVANHLLDKGVKLNESDLQKYVREVVEINNLSGPADVSTGQTILLPGHNKSGDLIVQEHDNTERTVTREGKVSVRDPDSGHTAEYQPRDDGGFTLQTYDGQGTTHMVERFPDADGGYVELHDVMSLEGVEGSYEITRTADGGYEITEAGGVPWDKTEYDPDDPDPRVERARLSDLAQESITDPEDLQKFQEDVEAFEQRARQQNLTPQEKATFYHEVTRLLEAGDSSNSDLPNAADRVHIAEQIMSHAADPQLIDQGGNYTCAVAALESQMFTRNPSLAARMIVDVATNGEFETASGKTVKPDSSLLTPDSEAREHPTPDRSRSYASQLFQATAISIEYSSYRIATPSDPTDSGERYDLEQAIINNPEADLSKERMSKPAFAEHIRRYELGEVPGKEDKFFGLGPAAIERINKEIAGEANPLAMIKHSDIPPADTGLNASSELDLGEKLKELKDAGRLPALIQVDARNEPFFSDSLGGVAGGSGAPHWVSVTGFDAATGKVSIDNQWGSGFDRKDMDLAALFGAIKPGGSA